MKRIVLTVMGSFIAFMVFSKGSTPISQGLTPVSQGPAPAQDATALRKQQFNAPDGLGIRGYDPVAYFTQNRALKGNKDFHAAYQGITYYFATAGDRDAFVKAPARYEPQYGGWCAYAMGKDGTKVEVDPGTFKIIDGHLFLFYNQFFNNTLKSWNKDETNLHQRADNNWGHFYH